MDKDLSSSSLSSCGRVRSNVDQPLIRRRNKKRKSDDSGSGRCVFDEAMTNPNEKAALSKSGDVFFDMKPRWRRAYMQEYHRSSSTSRNDMVVLCSHEECQVPASLVEEEEGLEKWRSKTPLSPTFRKTTENTSSTDESPVGVDVFDHGRVYFWERSLAFSEDGDDMSEPMSSMDLRRKNLDPNIQAQLSVPATLGRHESPRGPPQHTTHTSSRSLGSIGTRDSSRSRRIRLPDSFREVDSQGTDGVTEVHWEEKVLDFSDLDLFSKLSIS